MATQYEATAPQLDLENAEQRQQHQQAYQNSGLAASSSMTAHSSPASVSSGFNTSHGAATIDRDLVSMPTHSYASTSSSPFDAHPQLNSNGTSSSSAYRPRHGHSQSVGHLPNLSDIGGGGGGYTNSSSHMLRPGTGPASYLPLHASTSSLHHHNPQQQQHYHHQQQQNQPQSSFPGHQRSISASAINLTTLGGPQSLAPLQSPLLAQGQHPHHNQQQQYQHSGSSAASNDLVSAAGPLSETSSLSYANSGTRHYMPSQQHQHQQQLQYQRQQSHPSQYLTTAITDAGTSAMGASSAGPSSRTHTISPLVTNSALPPITPTPSGSDSQSASAIPHSLNTPSLLSSTLADSQRQHDNNNSILSSTTATIQQQTPTSQQQSDMTMFNNDNSSTNAQAIYSPSLGGPQRSDLGTNHNVSGAPPYSPAYHLQQNPISLPLQQQQQQQQQNQSNQQYRHGQGGDTPPSPSTAGGDGSHQHSHSHSHSHSHLYSLSDGSSMPYTPNSFTSQASSIPSSLHIMSDTGSLAGKIAYDVPPSPIFSTHPQHRPGTQQQHDQQQWAQPHQHHQHSLSNTSSSSSYPSLPGSVPASFDDYAHPARGHQYSHSHSSSTSSAQFHPQHQSQASASQQVAAPIPYPISRSTHGIITVYSASPTSGPVNSQLFVEIGIAPHEPQCIRGFRVLFGAHGTTTRVSGERRVEGGECVNLVATTPPIHLTSRPPVNGTSCQLTLQALDESGNVADWADLGVFEYTDAASSLKGTKRPGSPLAIVRDSPSTQMRPQFADQSVYPDSRTAVAAAAAAAHKRGHSRGSSIGSLVNGFGHMTHSRNSSMNSILSEYEPLQQPISYVNPLGQSGSLTSSNLSSSQPTVWYQTAQGELVERKPIARLRAPVQPPTSTPSSSTLRHPPMEVADANTPTLYRTSQLSNATPNDAPGHATKAVLKFDGDLNNMALGWTHDEWVGRRRLVQFTRKQEGSIISASFKPTALNEITPNTIVISCIFREDKNECFVTSVDTIYLLEALVSVRFTVEEKNRIRRNLEGYKPITVTKAKADCENFFKVIMGFPNPKPRNIEKDVKVFPWKILGNALKKIVAKYSASYLAPVDMVAPGKQPPQPIGWAPGRTPPPTGHGSSPSEGNTTYTMQSSSFAPPLNGSSSSATLVADDSNGDHYPEYHRDVTTPQPGAFAPDQGLGISLNQEPTSVSGTSYRKDNNNDMQP